MQPLDLNLASRPFRNNTLLWVGYGTAVVLLALFSFWSVRTYTEHRRLLADARHKVIDVETRTRELDTRTARALQGIKKFNLPALHTQADKANEVIDWKAFSWTRLFNLMADIQPYGIRMTSIRPIFRSARRGGDEFVSEFTRKVVPVSIQGTAKDFGAVAELQNKLLANPQIGRVEPDRLFKAENGEYVFEMRFYYLPPEEEPQQKLASAEVTPSDAVDAAPEGDAALPAEDEGQTDAAVEEEVPATAQVAQPVAGDAAAAAEPAPADAAEATDPPAETAEQTPQDETPEAEAAEEPVAKRPILRKTAGKPGRRPARKGSSQ